MEHLDVARLARLARIEVAPDHAAAIQAQLERLLDAFALADAPADGAPDESARAPLRDDAPVPAGDLDVAALQSAFPARRAGALDMGGLW